jgi:hypothetical protein
MQFSILSRRESVVATSFAAGSACAVMAAMLAGFNALSSSPWVSGDPLLAKAMSRCNELPHTTQREDCARLVVMRQAATRVAQR